MKTKSKKSYYKSLSHNGFEWSGFIQNENLHLFVKKLSDGKFLEMKCSDSDCFDGSYRALIEDGLTR